MLGMAVTGVVGCGIQEGLLLADPAAPQHDAMRFACHYALENVLPSVTWSTKPAHLVAAAHSLPMDVLSPAAAGDSSAAGVEPEAAARALALTTSCAKEVAKLQLCGVSEECAASAGEGALA